MKSTSSHSFFNLQRALASLSIFALFSPAQGQLSLGTAFTYQGSLNSGGSVASGAHDFEFKIFAAVSGGTALTPTVVVNDLDVNAGVFSTSLDFGTGIFTGDARWLEISVRAGAETGAFTTLNPRINLSPTPYALFAVNAEKVGGLDSSTLVNNSPPVALLEANVQTTVIPTMIGGISPPVDFNLNLSYDPEGSTLTYGFDPTGSLPGLPTLGPSPTISHTYDTPGRYQVEGWVQDSSGNFQKDVTTITVEAGGYRDAVVSNGDVGETPSLAVVDGSPAIAYYDQTNDALMYVYAADVNGHSWRSPNIVDGSGDGGLYPSLAIVNGNPAISYWDTTALDLMYIRANHSTGLIWGTRITVDAGGVVGLDTSLAVVNGFPAIAYHDIGNDDLKYVRALDANGTTWGTPLSIATIGDVGRHTSLLVVNGNPAISYYDETNGSLMYLRAADADGATWGTPQTLDAIGTTSFHSPTSMKIVSGFPTISYYDADNGDLKYIRASDASGSSWSTPLILDGPDDVGRSSSLAIIDGQPAISYMDFTRRDLKYIRATDTTGASWGTPLSVDSVGDVGSFSSLQEVNGAPAISYYDLIKRDLRYIR